MAILSQGRPEPDEDGLGHETLESRQVEDRDLPDGEEKLGIVAVGAKPVGSSRAPTGSRGDLRQRNVHLALQQKASQLERQLGPVLSLPRRLPHGISRAAALPQGVGSETGEREDVHQQENQKDLASQGHVGSPGGALPA